MLVFFWDPNDQDPNKPIENNKRKKQLISEASYHDKHYEKEKSYFWFSDTVIPINNEPALLPFLLPWDIDGFLMNYSGNWVNCFK